LQALLAAFDGRFELPDLFIEPLHLGGEVDQAFERNEDFQTFGDDDVCHALRRRRLVQDLEGDRPRQSLNDGGPALQVFPAGRVRREDLRRHLLGRRGIRFSPRTVRTASMTEMTRSTTSASASADFWDDAGRTDSGVGKAHFENALPVRHARQAVGDLLG
jgi:hypothetical protein